MHRGRYRAASAESRGEGLGGGGVQREDARLAKSLTSMPIFVRQSS